MTHTDQQDTWANGITLKKTRDGYSWSIAVASESSDPADLLRAAATASAIDRELRQTYPTQPKGGAR